MKIYMASALLSQHEGMGSSSLLLHLRDLRSCAFEMELRELQEKSIQRVIDLIMAEDTNQETQTKRALSSMVVLTHFLFPVTCFS